MQPLTASTAPIDSKPPPKLPLGERRSPMMEEPKYPPRLAIELITAIAAPAVAPLIREVAIAQNGPAIDCAPSIPKLIPVMMISGVRPYAATTKAVAPI